VGKLLAADINQQTAQQNLRPMSRGVFEAFAASRLFVCMVCVTVTVELVHVVLVAYCLPQQFVTAVCFRRPNALLSLVSQRERDTAGATSLFDLT